MYCKHCGKEISENAAFCSYCGGQLRDNNQNVEESYALRCPACGSIDVDVQVHQEQRKSRTVSKTRSKYRQKGHGCFWWLVIGWWWWMIDLMLWIFIFPIRFLFQLFRKKKYVGKSVTNSSTKNKISYQTVYVCKSCGHSWL